MLLLLVLPADARVRACESFDSRLHSGSYSNFVFNGTMQDWYVSIRDVKVILIGELVSFASKYSNPAIERFNSGLDEDCQYFPEYWIVRTKRSWKGKSDALQQAVVFAWAGTSGYIGEDVLLFLYDRRDVPILIGNGRPTKYASDTLAALERSIFEKFEPADDSISP